MTDVGPKLILEVNNDGVLGVSIKILEQHSSITSIKKTNEVLTLYRDGNLKVESWYCPEIATGSFPNILYLRGTDRGCDNDPITAKFTTESEKERFLRSLKLALAKINGDSSRF